MIKKQQWNDFTELVNVYGKHLINEEQIIRKLLTETTIAEQIAISILKDGEN